MPKVLGRNPVACVHCRHQLANLLSLKPCRQPGPAPSMPPPMPPSMPMLLLAPALLRWPRPLPWERAWSRPSKWATGPRFRFGCRPSCTPPSCRPCACTSNRDNLMACVWLDWQAAWHDVMMLDFQASWRTANFTCNSCCAAIAAPRGMLMAKPSSTDPELSMLLLVLPSPAVGTPRPAGLSGPLPCKPLLLILLPMTPALPRFMLLPLICPATIWLQMSLQTPEHIALCKSPWIVHGGAVLSCYDTSQRPRRLLSSTLHCVVQFSRYRTLRQSLGQCAVRAKGASSPFRVAAAVGTPGCRGPTALWTV